ncbi:nickel-responsive transcriptional regulator NikR [bacterium]|nr:nickel-responsive transcriptional regulator NikR [bacterium]
MSDLERYTITMPRELFESFDERIRRRGYKNRSEAIRDLVRADLVREKAARPNQRAAATITMVYDHHHHELNEKLTAMQHDFGELVVSTLHVHLDHHNCLEVLVLRGQVRRIEALADAISVLKGVKHASLTITTEGAELA